MISSPNKNAASGLSLGSKLDFFTIETTLDLSADAAGQALLNTLIETVAINGQPVISSLVANTAAVASQLTGATYSFKFAVEHTGAWSEATLAAALSAIALESSTATTGPSVVLTSTTEYENAVTIGSQTVFAGQTQASLIAVKAIVSGDTTTTGANTVVTLASQI